MENVTITHSEDILPEDIENVISTFNSLNLQSRQEIHGFRAAGDTPSYIQLLAELATWKIVLGLTTTAFLKKYAEKAAEDAYDITKSIAKYLSSELSNKVKKISSSLYTVLKGGDQSYLTIGFPYPNSWFNTNLKLKVANEQDLQKQIVLFLIYAEIINKETREISKKFGEPPTGFFIELLEDNTISMAWNHPESLEKMEMKIKTPL